MMDTLQSLSLGEGTLYKIEGDEYIPVGRISDAAFSTEKLDDVLKDTEEAFESFAEEVSVAISAIYDFDLSFLYLTSFNGNYYMDEPCFRHGQNLRPPREIFPRGLHTVDKRGDIRRRLRCMKIARQ